MAGSSLGYRVFFWISLLIAPVVGLVAVLASPFGGGYLYGAGARGWLRESGSDVREWAVGAATGGDPVYPSYLLRRLRLDWTHSTEAARERVWSTVQDYAEFARDGLSGDGRDRPGWTLYGAIWAGAIVASTFAVAGFVFTVVTGLVVALVAGLALAACGLVLAGVETALRAWHRVRIECPWGGCYQRIGLPVYGCECGQVHRRLLPNRNGVFAHVCLCGRSLPTSILLGRDRLVARCPAEGCGNVLPSRIGRAPVETVPIVGAPGAGKTTLLHLISDDLERLALPVAVESISGARHAEMVGRERLRAGVEISPTRAERPNAFVVDVRPRGSRGKILYFFDPKGEAYTAPAEVTQGYLRDTRVAVVVVDPLADPDVTEGLAARLDAEFVGPRGRHRLDRVLVVVTKTALVEDLPDDPDGIESWLAARSPTLTAGLGRWAADVQYVGSSFEDDGDAFRAALLWLVGLEKHRQADPDPGARPEPRPAPDGLPWRYRLGRRAVLGWQLLTAWSALALMTLSVVFVLTRIF